VWTLNPANISAGGIRRSETAPADLSAPTAILFSRPDSALTGGADPRRSRFINGG